MDDVRAPAPQPEPAFGPSEPAESVGSQWLDQHRDALDAWNAYIQKHGLPLARFRPR